VLKYVIFTARRSYASVVLGVVILSVRPSVCLSQTEVSVICRAVNMRPTSQKIWGGFLCGVYSERGSVQERPKVNICPQLWFLATESRHNKHIQIKFGV